MFSKIGFMRKPEGFTENLNIYIKFWGYKIKNELSKILIDHSSQFRDHVSEEYCT